MGLETDLRHTRKIRLLGVSVKVSDVEICDSLTGSRELLIRTDGVYGTVICVSGGTDNKT